MTAPKVFTIADFLTDAQIKRCTALWKKDRDNFHKNVLAEIIEPNMEEINRKLGQDNVAGYLAYAVEYVMMKASGLA